MTNQEHRVFTYDQKENGRKGKVITRSWLPGYVFLEIDLERDFWQQIYQMPGFLEILGRPSPISQAEFDVLEALIPKTLPKKDPGLSFNAGDSVMIIDGPWTSFPATIKAMTPDGKDAELVAMMFGRPSTFTLPVRAIEKI
jgi:transcriptional antiterminator NusG